MAHDGSCNNDTMMMNDDDSNSMNNNNDHQHQDHHQQPVDLSSMTTQYRAEELESLMAALERTISSSYSNCVFVEGDEGCGRSNLVDAFAHAVPRHKAFFCRGKFDQLETSAAEPLAAIISVLDSLITCLMEEAASVTTPNAENGGMTGRQQLNLWRERIQLALGLHELQHMQEMVPALRRLVSNDRRRSSLAMRTDDEAMDGDGYVGTERDWGFERFRLACRSILRAISKYHPVVMVLEQIDGAQRDSFEILRTWLRDSSTGSKLLFVATHESVPDSHILHKLMNILERVQVPKQRQRAHCAEHVRVTRIQLMPFQAEQVGEWLARIAGQPDQMQILPLVDFVYATTQGNALMMTQLFNHSQTKGWIQYDADAQHFTYDPQLIQKLSRARPQSSTSATATNHHALEIQLDGLDENQRMILTIVAFLGNSSFDVRTLAHISVPDEDKEEEPTYYLKPLMKLPPHEGPRVAWLETALKALAVQGLVKEPQVSTSLSAKASLSSPANRRYGVHSLIRTVAYKHLVKEKKKKKELHLLLGRRLNALMQWSKENGTFLEESLLFNTVNQMNLASELIEDRWELLEVVETNYQASEVAALKHSYFSALKYLSQGISLLGPEPWKLCDPASSAGGSRAQREQLVGLMKKLVNAQARTQLYCGQVDESLRLAEEVIEHCPCADPPPQSDNASSASNENRKKQRRNHGGVVVHFPSTPTNFIDCPSSMHLSDKLDNADKSLACRTKLMCLVKRDERKAALEFTLQILEKDLGQTFPRKGLKGVILRKIVKTRRLLRGRTDKDLLSLPKVDLSTEPLLGDTCDFLVSLGDVARMGGAGNDFMFLAMIRLLQITIEYGKIPTTALSYVFWGYVLAHTGVYEEATRFGNLGIRYIEQIQEEESLVTLSRNDLRAKIMHYIYIDHWSRPLQDIVDPLSRTIDELRSQGAVELVLSHSVSVLQLSFFAGRPLSELETNIRKMSEMFEDFKWHINTHSLHVSFFQMISNMRGSSSDIPTVLSGRFMNETGMVSKWKATGNDEALQSWYLCVATLSLFFNDLDLADEMCQFMWSESEFGPDFLSPYRVFLKGCVGFLLARANSSVTSSRQHKKQGEAALKQFNRWTQDGLANCSHFRLILTALRAACSNNPSTEGMKTMFDDAIDQCKRGGFIHFQALISELAGKYFLERKDDLQAGIYLSKARALYRTWQCQAKVSQMHSFYANSLEPQSEAWSKRPSVKDVAAANGGLRWHASAKM